MCEEDQTRKLLGIPDSNQDPFVRFRTGARTRAVLATRDGVVHRFQDRQARVVAKLYKGNGNTPGSLGYQHYHNRWFYRIAALTGNGHVQQSVSGGLLEGVGPYAVLQFIPGSELADVLERGGLSTAQVGRVLGDILIKIWIPLWTAGLRFKDCHLGNFVVTPDGDTVMIDTEQMRKDANELLNQPTDWTKRDKHQESGLARLPNFVRRIILAIDTAPPAAALLRHIKVSLDQSGLFDALRRLGREANAEEIAIRAAESFLDELETEWLMQ